MTTVSANGGGDGPETPIDALGHLTEGTISWNSDAYKFAMLITDADYKTNNQHGIANMNAMIEKLQEKDIQVSVITSSSCMEDYGELAAYTGGVQADITDNFGVLLQDYADAVLGSAQTKKDYTLKVTEKETGLPVANASISWNGGTATTNATGVATITTRNNPVQNFVVSRAGYVTYTASSFDLEKNGSVSLEMQVDTSKEEEIPADVPVLTPAMFKNPGKATGTMKGPSIKLFGKEFTIFSADIGLDLPIFSSDVSIEHNFEEMKYSVMIGREWEGTDPKDDPYWKSDYKKYKSLVETFSDKSAKDIHKEFTTLRKNHKSKADLALPVDINVAGYADISYATGNLRISEGGIIISASMKDKTIGEWPIPPAPYIFFKLTFSADAKGTFTIVTLNSSSKLGISIGLKDINISPALTGTLNLGVPKLVSVGGVKGILDVTVKGLPPKSLEEILEIKGTLKGVLELKLLGFSAKPELNFGSFTFFPWGGTSRSMRTMAIDNYSMNDFTPILPTNSISLYTLGRMSDTLTFEKFAYEDNTPQLIPYEDGWMMVWIDSDTTRAATDHMALYYSIYTESDGWSTPAMVADDKTGDFAPSLVIGTDGNPVVVWQNATVAGATTLDERLENLEICSTVFDPTTKTFGSAVTIPTTAGVAPLAVQAAAGVDGVYVYWLENRVNNPLLAEGSVSIKKCKLLTEGTMTAETVAENLTEVNGFAAGTMNDQAAYAYVTDTTLHYGGNTYTIGTECRSMQIVDEMLYWSDSEGFKSFDGSSIKTESTSISSDFTVVTNGADRAILINGFNADMESDDSVLFASISTNDGAWSTPVEIKQYDGTLIGSTSAALTDDGFLWAVAKTADEGSSLVVDSYAATTAVTVNPDAYVSVLTRNPGENVKVLVDLTNTGLLTANNLKARLADGTLVDMTFDDGDENDVILSTLPVGESVTASISYTLPDDLTTGHEIEVDIVSNNASSVVEWGTAKVLVEGYPDLAVEDIAVVRNTDGTATVSATIINNGSVTAVAPSVSLTIENTPLVSGLSDDVKSFSDLNAGNSTEISFNVPAEDIIADTPYDYKRFILTVTSVTTEYNVADNSASVLLAPKAVESVSFGDDSIALDIGETKALTYTVTPVDAATTITFMSNDTSVVTVDEYGVLTPLKAGTTTVSVMAVEAGKTDIITVTVNGVVDTGVNGVDITPNEYTLSVGQTVTLTATVLPANATIKDVVWNTNTSTLISIVPSGDSVVVTALAEGVGRVTAITSDGGYTDTAIINIVNSGSVCNVSTTWSFNSIEHWHECTCGVEHDKATHTESEWIIDLEATSDTDGSRHKECTICGYVIVTETIPATGSDFDYDYWFWVLMMLHNQEFDITASATEGGTITPAEISKVKYDKNITYTITPDEGYAIADVLVNGESVGAVSEYTIKRIKKDQTIHAIFVKTAWENPYTDVSDEAWYYEDVEFVSENGLMIGTGDNKFSPSAIVNRAMLVTVLWRLEGSPVVDSPVDFYDVPADEWYTAAVDWAAANGIVNGYGDGIFGAMNDLTHEQIMAILNRYAVYKKWSENVSGNADDTYTNSEWAENNVLWADLNGMFDGIGSDISDLTEGADRAELAAYLRRFCERFMAE